MRALDRAWRFALAIVLLAATVLAPLPATAQGAAEITQLKLERTDEDVLLTAAVVFELPPVIDEALQKGVPMHFVAEANLYRERWYWTDKRVASATRYMRVAYQPLTRRWRVQVSSTPITSSGLVLGQSYDTQEEALAALQRIPRWRIAPADAVDPDVPHKLEFRFRLDVSQLPRPFQIGAVGQSEWNLSVARTQRVYFESPR